MSHAQRLRPRALARLRLVERESPDTDAGALPRRWYAFAIGLAFVFGLLARASFVLGADFPLNDGGMFYAMARDVQANGYALPETTSYNELDIPFAYPPLGFYAAALVADLTPLSLTDALRFLPLTVNMLTVGAFVLLARSLAGSRIGIAAAAIAFALAPRSFAWMIMGGGITRSFGFLFALLAIHQAVLAYRSGRRLHVAGLAAFAALTILSHAEMAWFMTFSIGLVLLVEGRSRHGVAATVAAALAAAVLTAPWWASVVAQHGFSPVTAAIDASGSSQVHPVVQLLMFVPTEEPIFPLIMALAVAGIVYSLARREYLLPAWILACGILDSRGFGTVATVPVALLAGIAMERVVVPIARGTWAGGAQPRSPALAIVLASVFVLYALLSAVIPAQGVLTALDREDRAAMAWLAETTPEESRVLVVTGATWELDRTSEWLPVLSERMSVGTVQGTEWLEGDAFDEAVVAYDDLQECAAATVACVEAWAAEHEVEFDYVYLPKETPPLTEQKGDEEECCPGLRPTLADDPGYGVAYDSDAATIFERR